MVEVMKTLTTTLMTVVLVSESEMALGRRDSGEVFGSMFELARDILHGTEKTRKPRAAK